MQERRWWRESLRWTGALVGGALLVVAVWFAVRALDWAVLMSIPRWGVACLAVAVVGNIVLTSLLFWGVTLGFPASRPVGVGQMTALIAASGLLNYVPAVRPGLWGRSLFLKYFHGITIRDSLLTLMAVLVLSTVVSVWVSVVLLLLPGASGWGVAGAGLVVLAVAAGPVARAVLRRPMRRAWLWVPLKAADLLVGTLRLYVAFLALGVPLSFSQALVAASGAMLVRLAGLTPNGVGLSEWVIVGVAAATAHVDPAVATAAALLDRAVEVAVAVVVGLIAVGWLRHAVRDQRNAVGAGGREAPTASAQKKDAEAAS